VAAEALAQAVAVGGAGEAVGSSREGVAEPDGGAGEAVPPPPRPAGDVDGETVSTALAAGEEEAKPEAQAEAVSAADGKEEEEGVAEAAAGDGEGCGEGLLDAEARGEAVGDNVGVSCAVADGRAVVVADRVRCTEEEKEGEPHAEKEGALVREGMPLRDAERETTGDLEGAGERLSEGVAEGVGV
jgi:hypothetical protein